MPETVGFVVQFPLEDQFEPLVPDQVVIVPADAVPAAAIPMTVKSVRQKAVENMMEPL